MASRPISAINEWSDHVYEAVGYGLSRPSRDFSTKGYFSGEVSKSIRTYWRFIIDYVDVPNMIIKDCCGQYEISIAVYFFAEPDIYLVDGSFTISEEIEGDNVVENERYDFTVGRIQSRYSRYPEWKRVFFASDIHLVYDDDGERFTIRIKYRVRKSFALTSPRHEPEPPEPLQTLSSDFKKLLFSSTSSDVVFKIGKESIPAHQLVLATRVPYFERLFASGTNEANPKVITIEDVDLASFKELLKFIYSGELPDDLPSSAKAYLPLAEKYDIQDLKRSCSRALWNHLTNDNVVELLVLAHLCNCSTLKEICLDHLKHFKDQLPKEDLEPLKLHPDLMFEFIQFV